MPEADRRWSSKLSVMRAPRKMKTAAAIILVTVLASSGYPSADTVEEAEKRVCAPEVHCLTNRECVNYHGYALCYLKKAQRPAAGKQAAMPSNPPAAATVARAEKRVCAPGVHCLQNRECVNYHGYALCYLKTQRPASDKHAGTPANASAADSVEDAEKHVCAPGVHCLKDRECVNYHGYALCYLKTDRQEGLIPSDSAPSVPELAH